MKIVSKRYEGVCGWQSKVMTALPTLNLRTAYRVRRHRRSGEGGCALTKPECKITSLCVPGLESL